MSAQPTGIAQQFDPNRNLSGGMGFTLAWEAEDRVSSISYDGMQKRVEYGYDGLGRRARIRPMESGVKTAEYLYVWDGLQLCEKRDSVACSSRLSATSVTAPRGPRGPSITLFQMEASASKGKCSIARGEF